MRIGLKRLLRRIMVPGIGLILVLGMMIPLGLYLDGRDTDLSQERERITGEVASLRRQIRELRGDSSFVADNLPHYGTLLERGLLRKQNRLEASDRLERLALDLRINQLRYEFQAEERYQVSTTAAARLEVVSTPIAVQIDALLDREVFAFLNRVRDSLGGAVILRSLTLSRAALDPAAAAAALRRQERPSLVRASVTLDWVSFDVHQTTPNS